LRRYADSGSQRMPKEAEKLKQVAHRDPWQITRRASFPVLSPDVDTLVYPVTDICNEHGLAAYTLCMRADAKRRAPDPAKSDGQYLVVLDGSLVHADKTYAAPSLVFVWPHEGAFEVQAGPNGLQALVLNFPLRDSPGSTILLDSGS